jgi:hypothetical protein
MRTHKIAADTFHLDLSREEFVAISNCMNEAMNALRSEEFAIRVESDIKVVELLQDQLLAMLDAPE